MGKKIKETTTANITGGYGKDFRAFKRSKSKKKNKSVPWYMKTVSEIKKLVVDNLEDVRESDSFRGRTETEIENVVLKELRFLKEEDPQGSEVSSRAQLAKELTKQLAALKRSGVTPFMMGFIKKKLRLVSGKLAGTPEEVDKANRWIEFIDSKHDGSLMKYISAIPEKRKYEDKPKKNAKAAKKQAEDLLKPFAKEKEKEKEELPASTDTEQDEENKIVARELYAKLSDVENSDASPYMLRYITKRLDWATGKTQGTPEQIKNALRWVGTIKDDFSGDLASYAVEATESIDSSSQISEPKKKAARIKSGDDIGDFDTYIKDLSSALKKAELKVAQTQSPNIDLEAESAKKTLKIQIKRAVDAYKKDPENWRHHMIGPTSKYADVRKAEKEKREPELEDPRLTRKLFAQFGQIDELDLKINNTVKKYIENFLLIALNRKPSTVSQKNNAYKWMGMIQSDYDGNLVKYALRLTNKLKNRTAEKEKTFVIKPGRMTVGKDVNPATIKATNTETPPEARSLRTLKRRLAGKKVDVGHSSEESLGKTLEGIYKKLGDRYIHSKEGIFDTIVSKLQAERFPQLDLKKVLGKYLKHSEGVDAENIDTIKNEFTGDEWKALNQLSALEDYEKLAETDPADLSEFERAISDMVTRYYKDADQDEENQTDQYKNVSAYVNAMTPDDDPDPPEEESSNLVPRAEPIKRKSKKHKDKMVQLRPDRKRIDPSKRTAEKLVKPQHSLTRAEEPSKEKRRAFQRSISEPRDMSAEEMASRREMGDHAKWLAMQDKALSQHRREIIKHGAKKEKDKRKLQMTGEMTDLMKILEGLLGDEDPNPSEDFDEEPWEKARLAKKKDFAKELSLTKAGKIANGKK
jgi:hypothetical protein